MVPEKQSFISEIIIYLKDWMSLNKKKWKHLEFKTQAGAQL